MLGKAQRLDFKRGMAVSAALHVFLLLAIGLAFGERAQLPPPPEESYVIVDLKAAPYTAAHAADSAPAAANQHGAAAPSRPSSTAPGGQRRAQNQPAAHSGPQRQAASVERTGSFVLPGPVESISQEGSWEASGESAAVSAEVGQEAPPAAIAAVDVDALAAVFAGRVEAYKEYPYMALKRGLTGKVELLVQLAADGSLADVRVVVPSGVSSLDESAVKAVKKACPFNHDAQRALQFVIPVNYELNG